MMTMSSGREGWGEDPFDIGQEALAIDRSLDQPWGHHPVMSLGGDEGRGLPAAVWYLGQQALAARRPRRLPYFYSPSEGASLLPEAILHV